MKKIISTAMLVMMTMLCVVAQPPQNEGPRGPRPGGQGGPGMNPAKMVEFMDQSLQLSDDQKTELTKIFEVQHKEMRETFDKMREEGVRPDPETMEEMRNKTNEQIKAILNDDQKAKYDEMLKNTPRPGGRPPRDN